MNKGSESEFKCFGRNYTAQLTKLKLDGNLNREFIPVYVFGSALLRISSHEF